MRGRIKRGALEGSRSLLNMFGEEIWWDSSTMMLVIVLSRYHTVDPMLLTTGNPFESHKDVFVRAVNVPT